MPTPNSHFHSQLDHVLLLALFHPKKFLQPDGNLKAKITIQLIIIKSLLFIIHHENEEDTCRVILIRLVINTTSHVITSKPYQLGQEVSNCGGT